MARRMEVAGGGSEGCGSGGGSSTTNIDIGARRRLLAAVRRHVTRAANLLFGVLVRLQADTGRESRAGGSTERRLVCLALLATVVVLSGLVAARQRRLVRLARLA